MLELVRTGSDDPRFRALVAELDAELLRTYVLASGDDAREIKDKVEITGTLVDSFGLLAIDLSSITALGNGDKVEPKEVDTGDVGEATEGRLLRLKGTMVGDLFDDSPFGFKLNIDDGSGPIQIFLFPGAGVPTTGLHAGRSRSCASATSSTPRSSAIRAGRRISRSSDRRRPEPGAHENCGTSDDSRERWARPTCWLVASSNENVTVVP